MRPIVLAIALTAALTGCASTGPSKATQDAVAAADDAAALARAIQGDWRDAKNSARDRYRHPAETLAFFGVRANDMVIEITPGGGWYTEILAPYLRERGQYVAAWVSPESAAEGKPRENAQRGLDTFQQMLAKRPAQYGRASIVTFYPKSLGFDLDGQVDAVLTFRNAHNWVSAGTAQSYFDAFFRALKPGGVLGVVDHRAKPGTSLDAMKKSGYLTEALVIEYATKAGFVLEAKSEINANAKDSADHPNGVWTLPPTNRHDAKDDAQYQAIGESDRMTLRFRKPR